MMFFRLRPCLFFDLPRKVVNLYALFPSSLYWLVWAARSGSSICAGWFHWQVLVYARFGGAELCSGSWRVAAAWTDLVFVLHCGLRLHHEVPILGSVPSRDLGGFMLNLMAGLTCVSCHFQLGIAWLWAQSSMR